MRHKQEKDDNEGIIWLHMDIYDRHVSHENWPREICVIGVSRNLRNRGLCGHFEVGMHFRS